MKWTQILRIYCVQEVKHRMREESRVHDQGDQGEEQEVQVLGPQSLEEAEGEARHGKQAMILKNPADDLGMAIIGGREHNLPIIISEIFPGTAVARSTRVRLSQTLVCVFVCLPYLDRSTLETSFFR